MIINETLAKGLKNRFFIEMDEELSKKLNQLTKDGYKYKKNTTGWEKYSKYLKQSFNRCAIAFYDGGSSSKPYLGFVGLNIDPDREFNKWNEKCLTGTVAIEILEPFWFDYRQAVFNIGEHAISRIYERGKPLIKNGFEVDVASILPELAAVPLWAAYWTGVIATFKGFYSDQSKVTNNFFPPIPSPNGLFLGEMVAERYASVEIRTFVNDSRLSYEQLEVKKLLMEAGEGLQSSPLTLYPLLETLKIDKNFIEVAMMSHHLLKNYDVLSHVLFQGVEEDEIRRKLQTEFKKFLKYTAGFTSDDLIALYKKIGIKRFHLEMKKSVMKHYSKSD
jgi:hypothetical protein